MLTLPRSGGGVAVPAQPPAVNAASAQLQSQLEGLLSGTLGPGRAVVAADVAVTDAHTVSTRTSYGRRGTAVASQSWNAPGYKGRSTTYGVSRRVITTRVVPGSVRSIHVAVLVSSTVPAATRQISAAGALGRRWAFEAPR